LDVNASLVPAQMANDAGIIGAALSVNYHLEEITNKNKINGGASLN
jgi:hypothetical protein